LLSASIREISDLEDYFNSLLFLIEKDFPEEPESEEIFKEAEKIWRELKKRHLSRELKNIERELKRAEEDKKTDQVRVLSERFERMTKKLGQLEIT
jgi:hypothetical protein